MLTFVRNAALAALVGLGVFAAMPTPANADTLYLGIGPGGAHIGVGYEDGRRHWRERHHRYDRDWRGRDRWDRDWRRHARRSCTPGEALYKAQSLGLRRAWVADVSRRRIKIRGHRDGFRTTIAFARAPHCPIIR